MELDRTDPSGIRQTAHSDYWYTPLHDDAKYAARPSLLWPPSVPVREDLPVPLFNCLTGSIWQALVCLPDTFRLRNQSVSDQVEQVEQRQRGGPIITQVDLARMHGVVADDSDYIECHLHLFVKPVGYQGSDVSIEIFARLTELLAQFLNGQPNQGRGPSRRHVKNTARLVIVTSYVIRQIGIAARRRFALQREDELVRDPYRYFFAVEALRQKHVEKMIMYETRIARGLKGRNAAFNFAGQFQESCSFAYVLNMIKLRSRAIIWPEQARKRSIIGHPECPRRVPPLSRERSTVWTVERSKTDRRRSTCHSCTT